LIVEWFKISGNIRTLVSTKAYFEGTEGKYVVKLTILPTENYKMVEKEVAFTVVTWDDMLQGRTVLDIIYTEYSAQTDSFSVVKGQTYALKIHVHGYGVSDSSRSEQLNYLALSMNFDVDVYLFEMDVYLGDDNVNISHYCNAYINSEDGELYASTEQHHSPLVSEEAYYGGTCENADTLWILFTANETGTLDVITNTRVI
jgi:hypothetical protein